MIRQQQKAGKQTGAGKRSPIETAVPVKQTYTAADGTTMTVNPGLDKFSGDEFVPEKYQEAGALLKNSVMPHSSPSFK